MLNSDVEKLLFHGGDVGLGEEFISRFIR